MPETPGDDTSPKPMRVLIKEAREVFARQMHTTSLLASFNNGIVGLVASLEEAREALTKCRAELVELRSLGKRKTYSVSDPVCNRCLNLAAELGSLASALGGSRHAGDGDTCSRCGAVVCVQRKGESEDQWRARFRATTHAGASRDGTTRDKG